MQVLTAPIGSASSWGLCYNNIIMARDHFSQAMRSPRFRTDAYQESAEAKTEKQIEDFLKKIKKKIKSVFIFFINNKQWR
jgi:hypothetical protein